MDIYFVHVEENLVASIIPAYRFKIPRGIVFFKGPDGSAVDEVCKLALGGRIFSQEIVEKKDLLILIVDGELEVSSSNPGFRDLGEDEEGRQVYMINLPLLLEGEGEGMISGKKVRIITRPGELKIILRDEWEDE
jgi:hypothetical protein